MLAVNFKTDLDALPLSLGTQELPQEKGTLSFSELMHGALSKKDAKEYLKNKITIMKSLSKEEIVSLPKTLKGLMQVASKIGVNVTKVMLKEIKVEAQNRHEHEIMTEQLVQTKVNRHKPKTSNVKTEEILKLLLRGEKAVKNDVTMTTDFSLATARVIAPTLESLLSKERQESSSKLDGLSMPKADSFEVKLNEAKQMTKYLSHDVKTAIEEYKSPFTRVKVQLNPQRLGEVDLTIVQRGKNLHINLSSNNAAIQTLAMNVNDLKTQLNNNGINNASLNFNNMSQDGSASQQQQNQHNRQQARDEYNYFESDETHEEITSSLEIVVPNYA